MMIGERLIDLRKDKGLTQKELSEKLFINYRTYSGYERNEIEASDDLKIKLAEFYNVSIDYLLGISENPHPVRKGDDYVKLLGENRAAVRLADDKMIILIIIAENLADHAFLHMVSAANEAVFSDTS